MSDPVGTVYVVSIYEKPDWRRLLTTQDAAAAEALRASIEADGEKARVQKFPPKN
ncbi:hypothetical protein [Mesorhizobium sp. Root102]|uniref:hypothetical protein n=1 Tax=Mesorhizobium sp. Root102 TaxID=1736422 RepID=UPI000B1A1EED|nr:hypothetical protein [Mesorhizobium sp. Root102]